MDLSLTLTSIFCSCSTVWLATLIPLISRISSPTCSVPGCKRDAAAYSTCIWCRWLCSRTRARPPCLWIIPPCMILATMQWLESFIFSVMPCGDQHRRRQPRASPRRGSETNRTMGSSVFFWNCTRRTLVTFSRSTSPLVLSGESPFR